jgi:hypothetical protein
LNLHATVPKAVVVFPGSPQHRNRLVRSDSAPDRFLLGCGTRFAAPNGTAPADSSCEFTNPCSIYTAASTAMPGTHPAAGDEIVLAPGAYSNPGDLGPQGGIALTDGVNLHGAAGQPRPVIDL